MKSHDERALDGRRMHFRNAVLFADISVFGGMDVFQEALSCMTHPNGGDDPLVLLGIRGKSGRVITFVQTSLLTCGPTTIGWEFVPEQQDTVHRELGIERVILYNQ